MDADNPPIEPSEAELDLLHLPRQLSWEEAFGNRNPVELDIGCGRGRFIIEAAQARPDVNFLGIDVSGKSLRLAKARIAKRGIRNAKIAWGDARGFIADRVADGSLQAAHLLFSRPLAQKPPPKAARGDAGVCGKSAARAWGGPFVSSGDRHRRLLR